MAQEVKDDNIMVKNVLIPMRKCIMCNKLCYTKKSVKKDHPFLIFCSRCNLFGYCSRKCQKAHWNQHKTFCLESLANNNKYLIRVFENFESNIQMFQLIKVLKENTPYKFVFAVNVICETDIKQHFTNKFMDFKDKLQLNINTQSNIINQLNKINENNNPDKTTNSI